MKYDSETLQKIRRARGRFAAMVATYGLGVFNDNFFRQSTALLAIAAGREHLQGWAMSVFALPYVLFAPQAGWVADRFCKRNVVIAAKVLELAAMLLGAYGVITLNWGCLLGMVFTMGLQSCLFSPSLNGSIPELYPAVYVTKANAALKVAVTAMILGGVAVAGPLLELDGTGLWNTPIGRLTVAATAVVVATAGLILSFGVSSRPAADPDARFPWAGPWALLRQFISIRRDKMLWVIVKTNVYIWFAGALLQQFINLVATRQFGWGQAKGSYLIAAQLLGLASGGILVSRLSDSVLRRLLPLSLMAMGPPLLVIGTLTLMADAARQPMAFAMLVITGFAGGMVMVPCEAFIQVHPVPKQRGSVLAAVNFGVFAGILVAGQAANVIAKAMSPSSCMALLGVMSVLAGLALRWSMRKEIVV